MSIDQNYNKDSVNAQSGKAVCEAISQHAEQATCKAVTIAHNELFNSVHDYCITDETGNLNCGVRYAQMHVEKLKGQYVNKISILGRNANQPLSQEQYLVIWNCKGEVVSVSIDPQYQKANDWTQWYFNPFKIDDDKFLIGSISSPIDYWQLPTGNNFNARFIQVNDSDCFTVEGNEIKNCGRMLCAKFEIIPNFIERQEFDLFSKDINKDLTLHIMNKEIHFDKNTSVTKADIKELATKAELDKKITYNIVEDGDTSYMNNEKDGGLIKLTTSDKGYAKVAICKIDEQAVAQIVATDEAKGTFAKIDARKEGICYTKKAGNPDLANDELVTKKDIADFITSDDIAEKADKDDLKKYTETKLIGDNGTALIFNEKDGGGAKFEAADGIESFVGVNDGKSIPGLYAQIYADKLVDGKYQGAKIDVTNEGIYYTVGNKSFTERKVADNEIATKGDLKELALKTQIEQLQQTITQLQNTVQQLQEKVNTQ